MRVLFVVGTCLFKNTSANMSHNSYIQGLLENGCDVDILMKNDSWGEEDKSLPRWEKAKYYTYNSVSFADKLRDRTKKTSVVSDISNVEKDNNQSRESFSSRMKSEFRVLLKNVFYTIFKQDTVYPLDKKWLKEAVKFKSDINYDLIVSNSSPSASHKLVVELKKKNRIKYKRWIQIWEDPWYFDIYGGHSEKVKREEHFLLKQATEIYYVSPLTLEYQKKYFPDCADKMKCIPLPFLKIEDDKTENEDEISFGYFGDYYSHTRNLKPFYDALSSTEYKGYIYGDSDLQLKSTENITVSGRVTLDTLSQIQGKTKVLVHLCNLKGGQIPGKIYHYSATEKPILFILDGEAEEKQIIRKYFEQFRHYYFCENDKESILETLHEIDEQKKTYKGQVVNEFSPKKVVGMFL